MLGLKQDAIVHKDHVEIVQYHEQVFRVTPYITDSYIHIFRVYPKIISR
jgi:hypothetical protein